MPDIDPAALSRTDPISQPLTAPLALNKINGISIPSSAQKAQKTTSPAQRIDLEPLYTNLKAAVGDNWVRYKDAISLFILGHLNQNELAEQITHYVADQNTEHLHNQLIAAIYGNVIRDVPDQAVASWVSANDKPTVLSKPVAGDEAEQRLKKEIMQLPARDRRRIKEVPDGQIIDVIDAQVAHSMQEYHLVREIKRPEAGPASAGGQVKTNWELEIRKRYIQPLARETLEFPSAAELHKRMNPICYEEAVPNGTSIECAEFMATALEHYLKAVVSSIVSKVRSDLPGFSTVSGGSVITSAHANELGKGSKPLVNGVVKETEGKRKEADVRESKRTLGIADMKIALDVSGVGELGQMATIMEEIKNGYSEGVLEGYAYDSENNTEEMDYDVSHAGKRPAMRPMTNGTVYGSDGHTEDWPELDDSEESWGWEGGRGSDRRQLNSLLDECLAI